MAQRDASEKNKRGAGVKFCFIAPTSARVLLEKCQTLIGGAEIQQYRLAQELQRQGHTIYFLVDDIGQAECVMTDAGETWRIPGAVQGVHGSRIATLRRWCNLLRLMRKVNADAYYFRMPFVDILPAAAWCRLSGKRFLFATAHDRNVEPIESFAGTFLVRSLTWLGMWLADVRLCQHKIQQHRMLQNLGFKSIVLPNGINLPNLEHVTALRSRNSSVGILFLGSIIQNKQPDLFVKLARLCPEYEFLLCGSLHRDAGEKLWLRLHELANGLQNLTFVSGVAAVEIPALFSKSALLVSTSVGEGFPNTFLEAWSWMVPVVSLIVDPGGVMKEQGLGGPCGTLERLAERVRELMCDEGARLTLARRCRMYVERHHNIETVARRLVHLSQDDSACTA